MKILIWNNNRPTRCCRQTNALSTLCWVMFLPIHFMSSCTRNVLALHTMQCRNWNKFWHRNVSKWQMIATKINIKYQMPDSHIHLQWCCALFFGEFITHSWTIRSFRFCYISAHSLYLNTNLLHHYQFSWYNTLAL